MCGPLCAALLAPSPAHAGPSDIDISGMVDHEGEEVLDPALLGSDFRQLVMEIGTMVSNKPSTPAATLGWAGFDVDLGMQFILIAAHDRNGQPSPWERAAEDEVSPVYHSVPTFSVRKGLPMSTEIGATFGWITGSSTGIVGGFGRVAILENYKPLPDVALKVGYAGYVGNDQLDVGALDFGVTVGSSWPVGRVTGVNGGRVSPWGSFTMLSVRGNPTIDEETEEDIGAVRYSRGDPENRNPPIAVPQFGIGVDLLSGDVHLRLGATWAPRTIPTASSSIGLTF
jgi:hypothetical protein